MSGIDLRRIILATALGLIACTMNFALASSQTLQRVKARGSILCGVSEGLAGFSAANEKGMWSGFDVDFCRAIAAAVFGDPVRVQLVPLSAEARFEALRDEKIDVLSRNSTWTMSREAEFGLTFAGVNFYDGQGFLVPRALQVRSALELDGAKVCVQSGTTTIENLRDFFVTNNMHYEAVVSTSAMEAFQDYDAGRCSVLTSDVSQLYALRLRLAKSSDHVILPDVISKEPLGPAVRKNDLQWLDVVKWVHFAMLDGEELGVSSKTIAQALKSQKPEVMRFVGTEGNFGEQIGLTNAWAANVIEMVGNYGEVYERNVGTRSKLGIPRGLNNLWTTGGIQYAPPIR
jgi:general L-amino acid transport system substrate-binding protein